MKFFPEFEEVKKIAADGKYRVLPVSCEMLSDFTTPIETMKILKNVSTHCYMLESAMANDKWGRYTFMGYEPKMEITCRDGEMKAGSFSVKTEDPSKFLRLSGIQRTGSAVQGGRYGKFQRCGPDAF